MRATALSGSAVRSLRTALESLTTSALYIHVEPAAGLSVPTTSTSVVSQGHAAHSPPQLQSTPLIASTQSPISRRERTQNATAITSSSLHLRPPRRFPIPSPLNQPPSQCDHKHQHTPTYPTHRPRRRRRRHLPRRYIPQRRQRQGRPSPPHTNAASPSSTPTATDELTETGGSRSRGDNAANITTLSLGLRVRVPDIPRESTARLPTHLLFPATNKLPRRPLPPRCRRKPQHGGSAALRLGTPSSATSESARVWG